jgi:hypothetical protein
MSGTINDFKELGDMLFRWNVRLSGLTCEYCIAHSFGGEIASDEL